MRTRAELVRLTDLGLLHRVATGFYVAVPDDRVGTGWMLGLEAAAAGIAVAAYGSDEAVVMGVSAARLHGAIPRALATAVVAVPTRHDPMRLADRQAVVRFVVRDTARLDAERIGRCERRWCACRIGWGSAGYPDELDAHLSDGLC